MSPVPLKKQSIAGTSTWKSRGVRSERRVEPTIERVGAEGDKRKDVTMMCGMRCWLWSFVMASCKVEREVISVSERSLIDLSYLALRAAG